MTNHGLNQSVYPLPIDDLQNMAKLTQQILPGGEQMAVGTGSDFPHFEMENHRKKGELLAICMYTHVYIYTCMCISTKSVSPRIVDMFTRLTNHQRNSFQSLWPAIIYGYCRIFCCCAMMWVKQ